jgi:hypothetical protein
MQGTTLAVSRLRSERRVYIFLTHTLFVLAANIQFESVITKKECSQSFHVFFYLFFFFRFDDSARHERRRLTSALSPDAVAKKWGWWWRKVQPRIRIRWCGVTRGR